jgi:PAS domain-containing protein
VARIWEFLGTSFEELKGRTLYDLISEKEEELQRLQTRCALEQLLSECIRHRYYNENACSPSWLEEAKKATSG